MSSLIPIVVVDDDPDDYELLVQALKIECPQAQTHYIANQTHWQQYVADPSSRPALFIIDFRLGQDTGLDLLKQLRTNPLYKTIPVIIWSGSANPNDILACYQQGANSFIPKSNTQVQLKQQMKAFCDYWFDVVQLPK